MSTSQRYTWDEVGRLFSFCTPSSGAKYVYRADGMRVEKIEGLSLSWIPPSSEEGNEESSGYYDAIWATNKPTTRYFYDGQMAMGEDYTNSSTYTTTKYGIGARGIDFIEHYNGSATTKGFPIYDAHGNMISTLYRNGSGWTADTLKFYDPWGNPTSSGGWMQRYCANLGHVQDDESGLTYMRARYYEPSTGRFVSEDPVRDEMNWYVYCRNGPTMGADYSGKSFLLDFLNILINYIISWGSNANSGIGTTTGFAALGPLASSLSRAKSAVDVEESWGIFMNAWTFTPLSKIDSSGTVDLAFSILSIASSIASVLGSTLSRVLGGISYLLALAAAGGQLASLCLGYSMRMSWYLDDIDR